MCRRQGAKKNCIVHVLQCVCWADVMSPLLCSAWTCWKLMHRLATPSGSRLSLSEAMRHICSGGCRVYPGRFFATFLLLLAIQRGYEAQAAAVDWIVGKDWSPTSGGAADGEEEDWLMALNGNSSPLQGASDNSEDNSSMDTQQLLGRDAADAIRLGDTASSRVQRLQLQQAAWARPHAAQWQTAAALEGGPAAADPEDGAAAGDPAEVTVAGRVRRVLRAFVDGSRRIEGLMDLRDTIEELESFTGMPENKLDEALAHLEWALGRVRDGWATVHHDLGAGAEASMHSQSQTELTAVHLMYAAHSCQQMQLLVCKTACCLRVAFACFASFCEKGMK